MTYSGTNNEKKGGQRVAVVFYVLAVLFALYCIGVIASKAAGTKFFLVWIAAAILCAGTGVLLQKGLWERLPRTGKGDGAGCPGGRACLLCGCGMFYCQRIFCRGERESALYRGARCADEGKRAERGAGKAVGQGIRVSSGKSGHSLRAFRREGRKRASQ